MWRLTAGRSARARWSIDLTLLNIHWLILLVVTCGFRSAVLAQSMPATSEIAWTFLRSSDLVLEVALPMTRREATVLCERMLLSIEQQKYFDALLETYALSIVSIDKEVGPLLVQAAEQLIGVRTASQNFLPLFESLRDHEESVSAKVTAADERLFADLSQVLAHDQILRLSNVKQYRERRRCLPERFAIHKARIDLALLAEMLELTSQERETVQPVLSSYEAALTPLYTRADQVARHNRLQLERIKVRLRTAQPSDGAAPADPNRAANLQQIEECWTTQGRAQLEVAQLNDRYIDAIVSSLPRSKGKMLLAQYQARSYPRVYPDNLDPAMLYASLHGRNDVDPDLQLVIEQFWQAYRTRYDRLCEQMELASDLWHHQLAFSGSTEGWQDHNRRMKQMNAERQAAHEEIIRKIRLLLPADVIAAMDDELREWGSLLGRTQAYELTRVDDSPDSR